MKQKITITISLALIAITFFWACNEELPTVENIDTNKIGLILTLNNVNGSSADLICSVTNPSKISISEHGLCWNTSGNPTTSDYKSESGALSSSSFNENIECLNPSTAYYVKAYIIVKGVSIYSEQTKITTTNGLSVITTTEITDTTATTAMSGGNITDDDGFIITARGVCWSTISNPTISDSHTTDGTGIGIYVSELVELDVNTTYYVRAYATNTNGTVYGNEISFTTEDGLPTLTTTEISNITTTTATSGGNIINDGGFAVTERGVCWSTTSNPTISDNHTTDDTGTGNFTSSLTELVENTTYYICAYATNTNGTTYGNELNFTTSGNLSDALIAYYPFNGNVNDESGNGNDGINNGATPSIDRFGNNNSAFLFTESYIDCNSPLIPSSGDWTVNLWIYPNSYNNDQYNMLFGQYVYSSSSNGRFFNSIDGTTSVFYCQYNGDEIELTGNNEILLFNWQMITLIRNGDNLLCYYNGEYDNTGTISGSIIQSVNFLIGVHTTDYWPTGCFHGKIDDIKIYDIALTESEIQDLYSENGWTGNETVTDYDGNVYNTVQIGNQTWMAKNLKTTHYTNGTEITLVESNSTWDALTETDIAYCYYDNSTINADTYGALYTWAAAMNGSGSSNTNPSGVQGVCPDGWHLPSDEELKELELFLGMSQADVDATGWRGTNEGSKLVGNSGLWTNGTLESNAEFGTSGFLALPAGYRHYNGTFNGLSSHAYFWSSAEYNSSVAWRRSLYYNNSDVDRNYDSKDYGFSVRCVKD